MLVLESGLISDSPSVFYINFILCLDYSDSFYRLISTYIITNKQLLKIILITGLFSSSLTGYFLAHLPPLRPFLNIFLPLPLLFAISPLFSYILSTFFISFNCCFDLFRLLFCFSSENGFFPYCFSSIMAGSKAFFLDLAPHLATIVLVWVS